MITNQTNEQQAKVSANSQPLLIQKHVLWTCVCAYDFILRRATEPYFLPEIAPGIKRYHYSTVFSGAYRKFQVFCLQQLFLKEGSGIVFVDCVAGVEISPAGIHPPRRPTLSSVRPPGEAGARPGPSSHVSGTFFTVKSWENAKPPSRGGTAHGGAHGAVLSWRAASQ